MSLRHSQAQAAPVINESEINPQQHARIPFLNDVTGEEHNETIYH